MLATSTGHPFYDGCGPIPSDKLVLIRKIQAWLQPQVDIPKLSDEYIYMFLHSNYDDVEKTKKSIPLYFSLRCSAPDLFLNQSPLNPDIQAAMNITYMAPLPQPTPEGYRVMVFKLSDVDANKFVHLHAAKAMILFNEIRFSEDGIIPGYVTVCDARGYTWSHLAKLSLYVLRVYMKYMQEAKPVRLKGLHVLYSAKIIDKMMTVVKPFIKAELQKLIHIHSGDDLSDFFKFVPQEIMPEDYGGKAKSLASLHGENKRMMETKYVKWTEEEEDLCRRAMDLRNKKSNSSNSNGSCKMTAMETFDSFKSLSID